MNLFPAMHWGRLPGITAPYVEFKELKGKYTQQTSFVGGVSNGAQGVSTMDLDIKNTQAKKSIFWFDNKWVALGAGIQSSHEAPIVTGINQTLKTTEVWVDGKSYNSLATRTLSNSSWVWQDSVGYVFPEQATAKVHWKAHWKVRCKVLPKEK